MKHNHNCTYSDNSDNDGGLCYNEFILCALFAQHVTAVDPVDSCHCRAVLLRHLSIPDRTSRALIAAGS